MSLTRRRRLFWRRSGVVLAPPQGDVMASLDREDARVFLTPTPLNTLLWRVVVIDDDGYLEGLNSVVADDGPIEFTLVPWDRAAIDAQEGLPSAERLNWFANGFVSTAIVRDKLVMSDLRMGQEPDYVFRHPIATRGNPHWHPIESRRLPANMNLDRVRGVWGRIWNGP